MAVISVTLCLKGTFKYDMLSPSSHHTASDDPLLMMSLTVSNPFHLNT